MKSTKLLTQEHKLILRALDVLDSMAAHAGKHGTVDQTDIGGMLDFLRWFADAHHQAKEDTILFPALKRAVTAQARPVEHMMLEHAQERTVVEQIETAARLVRISDFVSCANKLSSTLRNHIYKEDEILFEYTKTALSAGADEQVAADLENFETDVDRQILSTKLSWLRSMEWKYLRRA